MVAEWVCSVHLEKYGVPRFTRPETRHQEAALRRSARCAEGSERQRGGRLRLAPRTALIRASARRQVPLTEPRGICTWDVGTATARSGRTSESRRARGGAGLAPRGRRTTAVGPAGRGVAPAARTGDARRAVNRR